MKKLSIILFIALVALTSCTKSKEVHPEIGDGNGEIVTVGIKDVHVEYTRSDIAELSKVVFHYGPADASGQAQQFTTSEMTKKETFFELTLNDLRSDTLYWYYYELFPNSGDAFNTVQKTFHTQAYDASEPPVAELPTVVTGEVSEITANSAQCGGEVTNDGGFEVTERGICWSATANPTISNSHVAIGTGVGMFMATISDLEANTTYHVRAYAINEKGTAYGLDVEFATLDGHEYVDLDLPSGTLWATCNVGANSPEEYGDYFAWGETRSKDSYGWSSYQYCNGSESTLTKYCTSSHYGYNGFTDNLTTLLPEDDAATANWGADWRMPNMDEWNELFNNTTNTWTSHNGVNGILCIASNGNSVFLPAAGYIYDGYFQQTGSMGYYWLQSIANTANPHWASTLEFFSAAFHSSTSPRYEGHIVRPVRSSN